MRSVSKFSTVPSEQYGSPEMPRDLGSSQPTVRGHGALASRQLQIYAFDPQLGRRRRFRISLEIPHESLQVDQHGGVDVRLRGRLFDVVDYDAAREQYYEVVDLEDPSLVAGGGLPPTVDDPKFHQQMVYAVAMKVVSNFERALGRRVQFREPVALIPHAFRGRNAFFDPATNAIYFGYFRADPDDPGGNLPNQWIFTCLSHDIIAHEVTHAIVHNLRPRFREATNKDVYAFHEAIADIVAIFQHFGFPGVLADAVQAGRTDLSRPGPLLELAAQFGHSTGAGRALRSARDRIDEIATYEDTFEPHDRGAVLVRAVFDAFFSTYAARVEDLIRIATGGTGLLGEGFLGAELVGRITDEAGDTAQRVLDLCIRAFDYLPPLDITFSDYLRALVTADRELNPSDPYDLRANLVDAFLSRGIHPKGVFSANEESLLWPGITSPAGDAPEPLAPTVLDRLAAFEVAEWGAAPAGEDADTSARIKKRIERRQHERGDLEQEVRAYGQRHHALLGLAPDSPDRPIVVDGLDLVFRVGGDGLPLTEAIAQFVQVGGDGPAGPVGGLDVRAGTTVVFSGDGSPRYVVAKPLTGGVDDRGAATGRLAEIAEFVDQCDQRDPRSAWFGDDEGFALRMQERFDFALVHQMTPVRRPDRSGGDRRADDRPDEGGADRG
ncbi:hypothetical protein [Agromyces binzhouensis]|uniref:hypothetical protein n=1 Tax=Agromyces binzhouensis TaxID=1817495 RepID=UPI003628F41A